MEQRRPLRYLLPALAGFSLLIAALLLLDVIPFLRGGFGWRWPYESPTLTTVSRMAPGLVALAVYLVGVARLRAGRAAVFMLWVFVGAAAIPVAFLTVYGSPLDVLYTRTISGLTTGAYLEAARFGSLSELIRQWPARMTSAVGAPTHVSVSPPGWPALYLLATRLFALFPGLAEAAARVLRPLQCDNLPVMTGSSAQIASAWLGILAPVWAALTVFPIYFLGRELGGERVARLAAAAWPLIPSVSIFLGTLSTIYPPLSTTVVLLLVLGLLRQKGQPRQAMAALLLAGLLTGVGLTINFTFVPLGLMAGLLLLLVPATPWKMGLRPKIRAGLFYAAGLLLALGAYRVAAGYHLHALVPLSMSQHLELERPYLPWLWLHTWDVLLFVGLPVFGLFVGAALALREGKTRNFSMAILLTLLIMVFSGTARGETGRVWMFFMPLFLPGAGALLLSATQREWRLLAGAQVAWLLVLFAVIRAVGTGLVAPPDYAQIAPAPLEGAPFVPVGATFGGALHLQGYQAQYNPQRNSLTLVLSWEPRARMTDSYLFSALPVAPGGAVQGHEEWLPLDYRYPTTCWQPGEAPILDRVELELPEERPDGEWWLSLSAFRWAEDQAPVYLPVQLPDGAVDPQQVGIGPIVVPGK